MEPRKDIHRSKSSSTRKGYCPKENDSPPESKIILPRQGKEGKKELPFPDGSLSQGQASVAMHLTRHPRSVNEMQPSLFSLLLPCSAIMLSMATHHVFFPLVQVTIAFVYPALLHRLVDRFGQVEGNLFRRFKQVLMVGSGL